MIEQYKYFSTQRPVDIGTFPKPPDNPPIEIKNYGQDGRVWMEHDTILAWGELIYAKPLTAKQMSDYELKPSRYNPDVSRTMYEQAQIVGEWEVKNDIPEQERLTWWYSDMGEHIAKEYVTPKKLAERYRIAQEFPKVPSRMRKQTKQSQPGADRRKPCTR